MLVASSCALALGTGILLWSLIEYVVHRWCMHRGVGPVMVERGHRNHHREPERRPLASPLTIVAVAAGATVMAVWISVPLGIGFLGAYVAYERAHHYAHLRSPRSRYGRWVRRHHQHHHQIDATTNFGFTTPIWDVVFGTHARVPVGRQLEP